MNSKSLIYVAGHSGLVGSALVRALGKTGYNNLALRTHSELDLTDQVAVRRFFAQVRPEYVFLAAARVGGIAANNTYPAEFILPNILMEANVIESAHKAHVKKLLFLGSSCIYPKFAAQPMREDSLMSGALEPTNRPYSVAKIAGIETCWAYNRQYGTRYLAAMPTNLYGPGDNYDQEKSHVVPALIRKIHEAKISGQKEVVVWGTGTPRREFLYSDDLADACLFLMTLDESAFDGFVRSEAVAPVVNIGSGQDQTVRELAELIAEVVGFEGGLVFDASKPDGSPRKLLDTSRLSSLGWTPKTKLRDGLTVTYQEFLTTLPTSLRIQTARH